MLIDLLTFMQIVNNFALELYSKLCSFHNLFEDRNVCQISMCFEEANCAWNNWFTEVQIMKIWKKSLQVDRVHLEFIGNSSRYIHTHYAYVIAFIVYSIQVFSSHD